MNSSKKILCWFPNFFTLVFRGNFMSALWSCFHFIFLFSNHTWWVLFLLIFIMFIISRNEGMMVIIADDLDFGIWDVAFVGKVFIVTSGYPWPSDTVKSPGFFNQESHTRVHRARWAGQTGLGTSPGPPQRLAWSQSANVYDEHTDRQTDGGSRRSPCHALLLFLFPLLSSRPKWRS